MTATSTYYFPQRTPAGAFLVHFGSEESKSQPVSSQDYRNYDAAEKAAQRMNEQAGLVAPVDEDYCIEDEEDEL